MINSTINDILKNDESTWLEYKSYWYWSKDTSNLAKGWGEFLKDFTALFNTNIDIKTDKYFIFGYDDSTKVFNDFDLDKDGNTIDILSNMDKLKSTIIEKLKKIHVCYPEYRGDTNLYNIESLFYIEKVIVNKKKLMVIVMHPSPYLLELRKLLQGNEAYKEGNIIIRRSKKQGDPENCNASPQEILEMTKIINLRKEEEHPIKDRSIIKIVSLFKEKHLPSSEVLFHEKKNDYVSSIHFEIFTLKGKYSDSISFVYFSSYTSQNKTYKYIEEKGFLDEINNLIVLTDELNRKKGKIDKKRLFDIFSKKSSSVEVFYLEEFSLTNLYDGLFNTEIFHQGNFGISDFIKPYTLEYKDKTADTLLSEWYKKELDPLLVMKGVGGIGKTTVVKYFLDNLCRHTDRNVNILFINSHDIINDIIKNTKIDDIFDFYKIVADKNNISEKFNKKLLELSIDQGNLVICLDGLDEVITKVGNKFNINRFIESIFENYCENLEKTKIIITCRDYFWDNNVLPYRINTISLIPFDSSLAKKYFSYYFTTESKLNRALDLANAFALNGEKNLYIPYILDMIKENLINDAVSSSIVSNTLLPDMDVNDFLVGKVCEREIKKLDNLSIDNQIEAFVYMTIKYNGVLHQSHYKDFIKHIEMKYTDSLMDKFKAHPLIIHTEGGQFIKFRYDFFNEYFKTIYLAKFIIENNFEKLNPEVAEILLHHISYENSFTKNLKQRLPEGFFEDLKVSIYGFLTSNIEEIDYLTGSEINKLNSSLFILLLSLNNINNVESNTDLLVEIYEVKKNSIENLCIINLHTSGKNKPVFNFSGKKFNKCHFENYEYFSECKFSAGTYFTNTKFYAPLHRDGVNSSLTVAHIDKHSCERSGVIDIIKTAEENNNQRESTLRIDLKRIFRFFWVNSSFKQKLSSDAHKKFKNINHTFDILVKNKVIIKTVVTTKQKRSDKAYKIDKKYSNLRKIFEENPTCSEFEEIIRMYDNQ